MASPKLIRVLLGLVVGKLADIVLLDTSRLEDIYNTQLPEGNRLVGARADPSEQSGGSA